LDTDNTGAIVGPIYTRSEAQIMKLHEKLTALRKQKSWSQAELSERANVHTAHLSRLEHGKSQPSVDMLYRLSKAFGVTMDYLLDEEADEAMPVSIQDRNLADRLQLIDSLDEQDRQTIIHVIDSMLTKRKMLDLLTQKTAALK
jgi:transcriptional regulator with XRE-family HTH domain